MVGEARPCSCTSLQQEHVCNIQRGRFWGQVGTDFGNSALFWPKLDSITDDSPGQGHVWELNPGCMTKKDIKSSFEFV